uniref:Uncharacterized protein n=2 Tax=Eptatretus burgeri TaxID=7764 RepID=A0A8C4PVZ4_EPTBU
MFWFLIFFMLCTSRTVFHTSVHVCCVACVVLQATFPARRRSMSHIGALARGSVVGISGSFSAAVAAHVTRPTGLGHGRLAHALAWRGVAPAPIGAGRPRWAPPIDAPPPASPSPDWMDDVSAEARFAEAVRRQFAFSEARLLAWSSPLSPPLSPTHTSESPALPPQSPPLPQLSSHSASQSLCQSPALASSPSLGSAHTNSLSPDAPPPPPPFSPTPSAQLPA